MKGQRKGEEGKEKQKGRRPGVPGSGFLDIVGEPRISTKTQRRQENGPSRKKTGKTTLRGDTQGSKG